MLVISRNLVLSEIQEDHADSPVLGWHNVVTASNITADTEDAEFPATNLANPATHLKWLAEDDTVQYLTVATGYEDDIDYVGLAVHNLGSAAIPISVEAFVDGVWTEMFPDIILPDDGPAVLRFEPGVYPQVRLKMQAGTAPATIAVMFVGKLLVMQRRIYIGHTPLKHARKSKIVNGRSDSGNYLGSIVLNQFRESSAAFQLIDPAWYRSYLDPFLANGKGTTFFFAWRPDTYPNECGYAWLTNDPMPKSVTPSHLIEVELQMGGVA